MKVKEIIYDLEKHKKTVIYKSGKEISGDDFSKEELLKQVFFHLNTLRKGKEKIIILT